MAQNRASSSGHCVRQNQKVWTRVRTAVFPFSSRVHRTWHKNVICVFMTTHFVRRNQTFSGRARSPKTARTSMHTTTLVKPCRELDARQCAPFPTFFVCKTSAVSGRHLTRYPAAREHPTHQRALPAGPLWAVPRVPTGARGRPSDHPRANRATWFTEVKIACFVTACLIKSAQLRR